MIFTTQNIGQHWVTRDGKYVYTITDVTQSSMFPITAINVATNKKNSFYAGGTAVSGARKHSNDLIREIQEEDRPELFL